MSKLCERYSRRLAQNINKDIQIGMMCPSVMISGAGNFPVKKKEKQVAAWDKNHEDYKEVEAILGKINAIFYGKDVIKSDDESAIEKLQDKEYIDCKPAYCRKRWYMMGGNFLYTSDSRFKEITGISYPIAIHDRYEGR